MIVSSKASTDINMKNKQKRLQTPVNDYAAFACLLAACPILKCLYNENENQSKRKKKKVKEKNILRTQLLFNRNPVSLSSSDRLLFPYTGSS